MKKLDNIYRKPETGNRKPETGNRKPETGNRKPETGNRKPETGNLINYLDLKNNRVFAAINRHFYVNKNGD